MKPILNDQLIKNSLNSSKKIFITNKISFVDHGSNKGILFTEIFPLKEKLISK